ncbi:MAG: ABC transporter permease [Solirubrobacteraceae bacterium]|jgi:peptide/nickel transport system permease protein
MGRYIVRRLLWVVVLVFAVVTLTFVIFSVLPSADPARLRAGRSPNQQLITEIRHRFKLDKPIYVQYGKYIGDLVTNLDFGHSYQNDTDVLDEILKRLPATISLAIGGAIVWLIMGISVGIVSAIYRRSVLDRVAMGLSLVAISAPVFWLGLVALYVFADDIGKIPILPGSGSYVPLTDDPVKWFTSLILPWCVLAAAFAAIYARLLRGNLIETMSEDYIRTARAKGLSERKVILKHGLRSAITPVVSALGLDLGLLLAGNAILTETVFNIPGIGRLSYNAIINSDLPTIEGVVLFGALFIVVLNLIVDIAYAFIDPRVRYT